MKQLFGTDGIRGRAGEFPLDSRTARSVGASIARQYRQRLGRDPRFISGRDTRESGGWLEAAFHAGALSEKAHCESAGVFTTPGVAYLTRAFDFDAGIVISASHNPYFDNGIKIFLPTGKKVDAATEKRIEHDVFAENEGVSLDPTEVAVTVAGARSGDFERSYIDYLKVKTGDFSAKGTKIVLDCANGAASDIAPALFAELGAEVVVLHNTPDGRNINEDSGSTHIEKLLAVVVEEKADLGIALDGDADRALFADENGNQIDGDAVLWIMAQNMRHHGKLLNSTVVATVMSNIGLELALRFQGIELLRSDVGDKYVLQRLIETGSEIGGEQSGHIIFPAISLVGDGMMTGLLLMRALKETGVSLSNAAGGFVRFPQILVNVKVREKLPFESIPAIAFAAKAVEAELHGEGRLLLRYSGTENLARVMIEGKEQAAINTQATRLADIIQRELG